MLDIEYIRQHPEDVQEAAKNKKVAVDIKELLATDAKRRELQATVDSYNQRRNAISKNIQGKPSPEQIEEVKSIKGKLATVEKEYAATAARYLDLLQSVPNMPSEDTPVGASEEDNVVLRTVGDIPSFSFQPKAHWDLGAQLDVIDNERAAKVSGSRFTYLKGALVWLEFALIHHILSITTNRETLASIISKANLAVPDTPFVPVIPPAIIKEEALAKMARLEPKEDRYQLPEDNSFLVGSAEHTLGAMHMNETLPENNLPLRYIGFSPSFRREAGSHGKDVRGILRLHQFDKLEMEVFSLPETSAQEHELLVAIQEHIMQSLQLPYRVVLKCTADMGPPNARAVDIETWMPGQDAYRETHTADLMTNYQARRLKTKVKRNNGSTAYVHTNDATGAAIGRTLIAIMENNQQEDGSIQVPEALHQPLPFTEIRPL